METIFPLLDPLKADTPSVRNDIVLSGDLYWPAV